MMRDPVLKNYRIRHEQFLKQLIESTSIPAPRIKEAISYALFSGGKRIRPLLIYLVGELLSVKREILDIIAASVELTHCYSLIHDDLPAMDNDDLRRGKPTCHRAFDEATAILAGDGMQALAIDLLLSKLPEKLPIAQVIAITQILVQATGPSGMVSGQSLDLLELNKATITETQIKKIHQLKTGMLLVACVNTVLKASQATAQECQILQQFAECFGLLFQIQDDYLDRYNNQIIGKNRSSDQANLKYTYADLYPQKALLCLIQDQYEEIQQLLEYFGQKADALIIMLNEFKRTVI